MLVETEIKLRIPPQMAERITAHPLVNARLNGDWTRIELFNQYYDTEDLALDRAALALRLRRDGDQVIQTLKGRGESIAGLSVRNEWDWYLQQETLSLHLLQTPELPEVLRHIDLDRLQPLFRTDFTRTKAALCWQYQSEEVEIELALDRGEVVAGNTRAPLVELELELRRGPQQALLDFALGLAENLPLQPWDSAKAERGYRLIDPSRIPSLPPLRGWSLSQPAGQLMLALAERLAARAVCSSERLYLDDSSSTQGLLQTLAQLSALIGLQSNLGLFSSKQKTVVENLRHELESLQPEDVSAFRTVLEADPNWGWMILSLARLQLQPVAQSVDGRTWLAATQPRNQAQSALIETISEGADD
ncbi:CYTH domain-containing protein [Marinobacterium zhoushanense]|uniref:CYTH domain-containing protein n=1 Tax=Marinobacterium zhoushanense TaxID=1679163 RepID=A0ABQ1KPY6_9GAMM|nr:CYTH domain-containing protein [Marinobacterium zhoushanense]GGC06417.1 CYTH domain-containing protein [Marinobacterium zhoushanense]